MRVDAGNLQNLMSLTIKHSLLCKCYYCELNRVNAKRAAPSVSDAPESESASGASSQNSSSAVLKPALDALREALKHLNEHGMIADHGDIKELFKTALAHYEHVEEKEDLELPGAAHKKHARQNEVQGH